MAAHSTLSGADLHEPKGIESASANTVYKANGAGSGTWGKVGTSSLDTAQIFNTNKFYISYPIALISSATDFYIPIGPKSQVTNASVAVGNTFTTTDLTLTVYANGSSVGNVVLAASGSASGSRASFTPTSHTVSAGGFIRVTTNAVTGSVTGFIVLELTMVP